MFRTVDMLSEGDILPELRCSACDFDSLTTKIDTAYSYIKLLLGTICKYMV